MIDFERDVPKVDLDFMNHDHREATGIVNDLLEKLDSDPRDDEAIAATLEKLLTHNREHFAREEAQMEQFHFPPYPVHKGEHERVLAELEAELAAWRENGDIDRLKHYAQVTLANWFINHIATMDTITARYIAGAGGPA